MPDGSPAVDTIRRYLEIDAGMISTLADERAGALEALDALSARLAVVEAERDMLIQNGDALAAERDTLRERADSLELELDIEKHAHKKDNEYLLAERDSARRELTQAHENIDQLQGELKRTEGIRREREQAVEALRKIAALDPNKSPHDGGAKRIAANALAELGESKPSQDRPTDARPEVEGEASEELARPVGPDASPNFPPITTSAAGESKP